MNQYKVNVFYNEQLFDVENTMKSIFKDYFKSYINELIEKYDLNSTTIHDEKYFTEDGGNLC